MHRYFEKDNYRYDDFSGFINEERRRHKKTSSAKSMYSGDMWDKGKGYIGPVPVDDDDNAAEIMHNIQRMFTSRNVIEEVVDRQVDALLSKSPDWKIFNKNALKTNPKEFRKAKAPRSENLENRVDLAPSPSDDTTNDERIVEAETVLAEVWLRGGLGDALKASLTERLISGKGLLRITISKRYDKKKDEIEDLFEAAKYIKIEHVDNGLGKVIDDDGEKLSVIEVINNKTEKVVEISFVDDDDRTIIASVDKAGTLSSNLEPGENETLDEIITKLAKIAELSNPMFLDGNITADEILGKPFVSDSMLQNNRALNLDLSLAIGVLVEAGYSEMVVTNVALETTEVPDPNNPTKTIKKPVGLKRGAGVVNNLVGEQTVTAEGEVEFQTPGVTFKEPSQLTPFLQGESLFYRQVLSESKQTHVLLNVESDPSGEARVQSRQDFVKKSQKYKPSLDIHGTWALNAVMHMAASLAGKDGYFDGIECLFDSKIYAGELSAEEQDVVIARYEHGLVARETAMVLLGTEDPILELDMINKDEEAKLELQVRRLEATANFGNMKENGRPSTSEKTKQKQEEKDNTKIRRNRNKKS